MEKAINYFSRIFRVDIKYIIEGGFWLTLTKLVGLFTALASSIIFANILPAETYGTYQYILSLMPLLVLPTLSGIDTALTRAVARGNESVFYKALGIKIKGGLIGSIISLCISAYYFYNHNHPLGYSFALAAFFIPIMDPSNLYIAYQTGKKQFKEQTYSQLTIRTVASLIIIAGAFFIENVVYLFLLYLLSYSVLRLIFLFHTIKTIPRPKHKENDDTLSYGFFLTLRSIPTIISKTYDSIILFHLLGPAALAGYVIARMPTKHGMNFLDSINMLALPKFSQSNHELIGKTLMKKVGIAYLFIVPIVIMYWLSADMLFSILFKNYTDYILVSKIFSLQFLSLPFSLIDTALTAYGEKKKMYIYVSSTAVIRLVLLTLLIPIYGVMGAASAFVITSFIACFMLWIILILFRNEKIKIDPALDTNSQNS